MIFCKRTSFAFQEAVFHTLKDGFLGSKRAPFRTQKVAFWFPDSYKGVAEQVFFGWKIMQKDALHVSVYMSRKEPKRK